MELLTLDNGLRVIKQQLDYLRSVSVGVWIKSGSRYETPEENGISHFIEHMLFKGTQSRDARRIAAEIDDIGGVLNAFTSKECTCFYVHVTSEHLNIAVELLADMLKNSLLDAPDIVKEQSVVCEEISMVEDTPDDLVHELSASGYFGSHPLGMTILGKKELVNSFTAEKIRDYMARRYVTGNIVLSVAGCYDDAQLNDLVARHFGCGIPVAPTSALVSTPVLKVKKHTVTAVKDNEQMNICLTYGGVSADAVGFYPLSVFNAVFGASMSSRLFQTIREQNGLTYTVYSYPTSYADCGIFSIYAGMNPSQTQRVLELVRQEIDLAQKGLTERELTNAKEQVKGGLMLGLEGARSIMSRNGRLLLMNGKVDSPDTVIEGINSVTNEQILTLVHDVFCGDRCCAMVGKRKFFPKDINI